MKKALTIIMVLLLSLGVFTGCNQDPVSDEFEKFLNIDMIDANELYADFKNELDKWEEYTTNEELISSIENIILINLNTAKKSVEAIELNYDEIKSIKTKYLLMLDKYIESYEIILKGLQESDADLVEKGKTKLQEGVDILNEYNMALEDFAKKNGLTIKY